MKTLNFTPKLLLVLFAFLSFIAGYSQAQKARMVSIESNTKAYYEYLPQGYDAKKAGGYPVLIFVHGAGETGPGSSTSIKQMTEQGPFRAMKDGDFPASFNVNGKTYKLIVIAPQFVKWPTPADIDNVIDYVIAHYNVDSSRIYLSGLSMGGGVCWQYAGANVTYAKRLAAMLPFCGAAAPTATRINSMAAANLPVWATHNDHDKVVSPAWTQGYINGMNAYVPKPNPPAKITLFNSRKHNAWSMMYDCSYKENGLDMYEWMLQYSRGTTVTNPNPPPANKAPVVNAGKDTTLVLPVNYITLSSKATDADGSVAIYAWSKISGPSTYKISNISVPNPKLSNLVTGIYVFRLRVKDNDSASAYDDISITVNPANNSGSGSDTSKTINVNITNQSILYNNNTWNNWALEGKAVSDVSSAAFKYSDGSSSSISATLSYSLNVADNKTNYVTGMAPAEVLRMTSYSKTARTLTIKGLSANKKYNIDLYASRALNKSSSIFTLGSESDTVLTYFNNVAKASFINKVSNSSGIITISIKSGLIYNYINGFTLIEKPGSSTSARTNTITKAVIDSNKIKTIDKPVVSIYPNPVRNKFMLQLNDPYKGALNIQIVDISGKVRKTINYTKNQASEQIEVFANDLPAGIYIVQVKMGTYSIANKILKL